jgi:hypothetical protein
MSITATEGSLASASGAKGRAGDRRLLSRCPGWDVLKSFVERQLCAFVGLALQHSGARKFNDFAEERRAVSVVPVMLTSESELRLAMKKLHCKPSH